MSGYNLPDGLSEQSPSAPWNQPTLWDGKICGDCRHSVVCHMSDWTTMLVCTSDIDFGVFEVGRRDKACELFEAI